MKKILISVLVTLAVTIAAKAIAKNQNVFLAESKVVSTKLEWNREIEVKHSGSIYCAIENEKGMMSVTVLANRTYQALMNKNRKGIHREDLILTIDSSKGYFEDRIDLPKGGSYWFIIENGTQFESEITIACADM